MLTSGALEGAPQEVPALTGRIVDRADLLAPESERELEDLLAAHEASTGNQVVVLTIGSLQGAVLEAYALQVARTWALGQEDQDNGVLLLVALQDRQLRIEVGYGLEGALPDALAGRIIRNEITPRFREGDYEAGIRAGVLAILGALEGTYAPPETADAPPFWFGLLFLIMPVLFTLLALFTPGCTRWFLFLFLMPFYGFSGFVLSGTWWGGTVLVVLYGAVFLVLVRHPKVEAVAERIRSAQKAGKKVRVGPFTISPGSGGGGFSGGGGSFGGGGASGSW